MARNITSDGYRFYINGEPSNAVVAHKALVEDLGMADRAERIELLVSIKQIPQETPR
ncbi:hypothetical protein [Nocardiopsis metallicus]|uniref:Uncharacterized protein n=1 Tax=Nocardiopsis metallicus TaxID=179819 RepID=A0A840WHE6_9ACTN|nr:hypothetical protein [Nocardiopsis metallicus]MBB5491335.1 hypothetical protein [Nocardiopsis metallicus]